MADTKKPATPPPTFTRDELLIINNALNEICNGISMSDSEFQTRIGHTREAARKLLAKVGKSLEK
jgi:hypothetical protein